MTFGEKLQKLRTRAGLSQDQLAELLDVSRQAVSKWERNEAMPEAEKLVRISRQFGVSTDYLLLEELEAVSYTHLSLRWQGFCGPSCPQRSDLCIDTKKPDRPLWAVRFFMREKITSRP